MDIDPVSLPLLGEGKLAAVYALDDARALKVFHAGCPLRDVQAEMAGAALALRYGVAAPRVEALYTVGDRYALLMERIDGPDLLQSLFSAREDGERLLQMERFAKTHQALLHIHAPDAPDSKQRLRYQLLKNGYEALALRLDSLPDGDALCHGDFHPGNVLLRAGQPVVIDFMTYGRGAAILDIARTYYLMANGMRGLIDDRLHDAMGAQYLACMGVRREALLSVLPIVMAARLAESPTDAEKAVILAALRQAET